eukprot:TRINITY_DN20574_c0_g1_i2.p1 TRINITY_DN20574_c0_g1~~TRINITY_DN20574_c0_g1_i2.p1  ORF type:complete len:266 (-),score=47.94 TRINITY_DN20574_c0_g1_i2:13-810(-)
MGARRSHGVLKENIGLAATTGSPFPQAGSAKRSALSATSPTSLAATMSGAVQFRWADAPKPARYLPRSLSAGHVEPYLPAQTARVFNTKELNKDAAERPKAQVQEPPPRVASFQVASVSSDAAARRSGSEGTLPVGAALRSPPSCQQGATCFRNRLEFHGSSSGAAGSSPSASARTVAFSRLANVEFDRKKRLLRLTLQGQEPPLQVELLGSADVLVFEQRVWPLLLSAVTSPQKACSVCRRSTGGASASAFAGPSLVFVHRGRT